MAAPTHATIEAVKGRVRAALTGKTVTQLTEFEADVAGLLTWIEQQDKALVERTAELRQTQRVYEGVVATMVHAIRD
jgi:hypothetical protein